MSALSSLLAEDGQENFFHQRGDFNGRKNFSLSPLLPASFWRYPGQSCQRDALHVEKEQCWAFRIAFLKNDDFEKFRFFYTGKTFEIKSVPFEIISISLPGDNDMSMKESVSDILTASAAIGVDMHFFTPTGFKAYGDVQQILPVPELIFDTLARRFYAAGIGIHFEPVRDVIVQRFKIESSLAFLKNGYLRGCVGVVSYSWNDAEQKMKQQLTALSRFAFYSGVGYKTAQGMGQVLPKLRF